MHPPLQLWRLDATGAALGQSVLRPWRVWSIDEWSPRDFHYAADGSRLVWTEEAKLMQLDVASDAVSAIDTPFVLLQ